MSVLHVIDRAGVARDVIAKEGLSVMEIIRDAGFDELLALCGGCCSCSTCHIFVTGGPVDALSPIAGDEDDLLDSSDYRTSQSRLACQLPFATDLDGLIVTITPED